MKTKPLPREALKFEISTLSGYEGGATCLRSVIFAVRVRFPETTFPTPIAIPEESGMPISRPLRLKKTALFPERTYAQDASDPEKLPEQCNNH